MGNISKSIWALNPCLANLFQVILISLKTHVPRFDSAQKNTKRPDLLSPIATTFPKT